MFQVRKRGLERVVQHSRGLAEIDPMFLEVGGGFPWIPFENHNQVYARARGRLYRLPYANYGYCIAWSSSRIRQRALVNGERRGAGHCRSLAVGW